MKEFDKIDELLKSELSDFSPEVPADVWTQISSQLPTSMAPVNVNPVSGLSIGVKSALITGIMFVAGTSYWYFVKTEKSAILENNQVPIAIESPKTQVPQDHSGSEQLIETENTPAIKTNQQKPHQSAEEKSKGVLTLNKSVTAVDHPKAEISTNQESLPAKFENLVSVDTKTEVVEGNPEHESMEEASREEHKTAEADIKRDVPIVNNVFTPNGDGINDELVIEMPSVDFYQLRIYSKKGALVFETDQLQTRWKGMILGSGLQAEPGDYRYVLEYQIKGKENVKVMGGYIYLNR